MSAARLIGSLGAVGAIGEIGKIGEEVHIPTNGARTFVIAALAAGVELENRCCGFQLTLA